MKAIVVWWEVLLADVGPNLWKRKAKERRVREGMLRPKPTGHGIYSSLVNCFSSRKGRSSSSTLSTPVPKPNWLLAYYTCRHAQSTSCQRGGRGKKSFDLWSTLNWNMIGPWRFQYMKRDKDCCLLISFNHTSNGYCDPPIPYRVRGSWR